MAASSHSNCLILIIFTLKQHTHARAHTHTHLPARGYLPLERFPLTFLLKCSLLSCSCQSSVACVYPTVARVCLWSISVHVSFPGHTHLFDKTHMTVRTNLALTFTFVGIAFHSPNWFDCRKC